MPLIQMRDVPDHIYRKLCEEAERDHRSVAQQALTVLARGLEVELDSKSRRRRVLEAIAADSDLNELHLSDPARLIAEDRHR